MITVINPIDKEPIKAELTKGRFVRESNKGNNQIYILNHFNSPNVMQEIARLREITFRLAGGGTGKEIDIDEFDTCETPYEQLIVWDPREEEIIGGYRYIRCADAKKDESGIPHLSTTEILHFRKHLLINICPTPLNWAGRLCNPNTNQVTKTEKGCFHWTTFGTDWEH